jgi:glycolate oxidase FAD binding subunit
VIAKPARAKRIATASFALGSLTPERIVEPRDAAEAAAILRAANDAGEAVVAYGGGTLQRASNAPARYDVALSTKRLNALHEYDPRELTAGVGGGMTVAELDSLLARNGQFLPLDAPFAAQATIGGTLAAGWAGPRRAAYGRPRDLLIGATVALADGTLAKTGGMVVKNVTGYDMGKLYVGSHGTLGVIVRANFKVLPAPALRRLAIAPFDDDLRERAIAHASALSIEPAALLVLDGFHEIASAGRPRLFALLEGSDQVVERATRELRSALGAAGIAETRLLDGEAAASAYASVLDAYATAAADTSVTFVARGLPSEAVARAQRVRDALGRVDTIADLRTGDVVVRVREGFDTVRAVLGGAVVLSAGPAAEVDAWGEAPATLATLATMRALKAQFDPRGVLAPGRFVGGI